VWRGKIRQCSKLDRANDRLLLAFGSGKGRVAASSMGIAGNSGMSSSFYYLLAKNETRQRLVDDPDSYCTFMQSQAVMQ